MQPYILGTFNISEKQSQPSPLQFIHAYNHAIFVLNGHRLSFLSWDRKHWNKLEKDEGSNQDCKAQCMSASVAVQQLHVFCSQSWWSQTFSRRALKRTAALVSVSGPFFHIVAGQLSVWLTHRQTTAGFRSVKMERLFPGLLVALWCLGSCVQHLSKKLLPANWRSTVWKILYCWR